MTVKYIWKMLKPNIRKLFDITELDKVLSSRSDNNENDNFKLTIPQ